MGSLQSRLHSGDIKPGDIYTGSPHIWIKDQIAFFGGHFDFLIRARGKLRGLLVRGLEPRFWKSGQILGGSDCWPKVIKLQGMKFSSQFSRRMSLPVGGNGNKTEWKRDRKSIMLVSWRAFVVLRHGGQMASFWKTIVTNDLKKKWFSCRRCRRGVLSERINIGSTNKCKTMEWTVQILK